MARQKVVGIPWFKAESYDACRAMMNDGPGLPPHHGDWLQDAEALRREAEGLRGEIDAFLGNIRAA